MDDSELIMLFNTRNEKALAETINKYGKLCKYVAQNIIAVKEDVEECLNDTYMTIWTNIPPEAPECFSAYITRIVRNKALKRLEYNSALKRNSSFLTSISELGEILDEKHNVEEEVLGSEIKDLLNVFLRKQKQRDRVIFMKRYLYFDSLKEISLATNLSEKTIASILYRMRIKLKNFLLNQGVEL